MLYNETTKKMIIKTKHAKSHLQKAIGLMFSCKKKFDYGLIFDMGKESIIGSSIHMMFVFYPIFVVFLNEDKVVVDAKVAKSWRFYSPKFPARYVLELPTKFKEKIKEGERLVF